MLQCLLVRNGKFLSAFSSARRQHSPAIGRCHSVAETVLIFSLSLRRLKGTFHSNINIYPKNEGCKDDQYFYKLQD